MNQSIESVKQVSSALLCLSGVARPTGKGPALIAMGGFEAAMVGRLREAQTLPVLPQGRDDILFGSAEDIPGQVLSCLPRRRGDDRSAVGFVRLGVLS